jgi:hypothetical protein
MLFSLFVSVRVSAIFCRTLSVGCIELHIFCVLNLYRPIGFLSFFFLHIYLQGIYFLLFNPSYIVLFCTFFNLYVDIFFYDVCIIHSSMCFDK